MKIEWMEEPELHDYDAACSYLNLFCHPDTVTGLVDSLQMAEMTKFKAKDIARASGHDLLGIDNGHVQKNIDKVHDGKKLSPILLVRVLNEKVIIADGFHRVSAVYQLDEDAWIPCKIV